MRLPDPGAQNNSTQHMCPDGRSQAIRLLNDLNKVHRANNYKHNS